MKFSSFVITAMVLLSFGGCLINQKLTRMHIDDTPLTGVFADVCTPDGNPEFDCKKVIKTKWAVLPPNEPDPTSGKQVGVPVALLGWWYFTGVGLWGLLIGRCDFQRRGWHYLLLLAILVGCAVSVFYLYILFFSGMEAKCLWCIISHAINFLLLLCALLLIPHNRSLPAEETAPGGLFSDEALREPQEVRAEHPSGRLVLATVVAVLAMAWCEFALTASAAAQQQAKAHKLKSQKQELVLNQFYEDSEALLTRYDSQEAVKIPHRPDDPRRGEGNLLLPMVVFSDFQCPACRQFAKQLDSTIGPAFEGKLRIYWKHMPWSSNCNPHSKRDMHPQACDAAFAAEAARMLGGNEAFWAAHDWLFEHQSQLAKLDYRDLAVALKLDPDALIDRMGAEEVKQRVREDIELAKSTGVKGTPAIYLWGRRVDRRMLLNSGFTDHINARFKRLRTTQLQTREKWDSLSHEEQQEMIRKAQQKKQKVPKGSPSPAPDPDAGTDGS